MNQSLQSENLLLKDAILVAILVALRGVWPMHKSDNIIRAILM